jgi:hypothetical protein
MKCEDVGVTIAMCFVGLVALFLVFVLLVVVPIKEYTKAECLEAGYPRSYVTYNFKRYCANLQGSVTVKVEKLK